MKQGYKGFLKDLIFHMKENIIVRLIAYPYCTWKRKRQTRLYAESYLSQQMKQWENAYKGKRCFIVGNGPSLKIDDLKAIEHEITFASNRIYHLYDKTSWRPDFYVAFEPQFCKENADMISRIDVKNARFLNVLAWDKMRESSNTYWMNCTMKYSLRKQSTKNIEFSHDISLLVNDAYSVTFTMLQIAIYMGFKEIYLLGIDHYDKSVDFSSRHFYKSEKNEYQTPTFLEGIEYGYELAKKVAEQRGIKIFNTTKGGKLEVFPRVDFEKIKQ